MFFQSMDAQKVDAKFAIKEYSFFTIPAIKKKRHVS